MNVLQRGRRPESVVDWDGPASGYRADDFVLVRGNRRWSLSTWGDAIKRILNRPGGRAILGLLMSHSAGAKAEGRRVFYRDGFWVRRLPDGFVVSLDPDSAENVTLYDSWTRDAWEYGYQPTAGDVVIDIGAGVGEAVHRWSRAVGAEGRVIAVEAHPVTYRRLELFCELNGLDNVMPVNAALSDAAGTVLISDDPDYLSASIVADRGVFEVESKTLDSLLRGLDIGRVDYIKMNIEGAEVAALRGMPETLARTRHLTVSCHDFRADRGHGEHFRTRQDVIRLLMDSGFDLSFRLEDPLPEYRDQVLGSRRMP